MGREFEAERKKLAIDSFLLPPLKLVAMTVFSFEAGNRHISPAMNFPSMGLMFKN
jgi:hypothetical protein